MNHSSRLDLKTVAAEFDSEVYVWSSVSANICAACENLHRVTLNWEVSLLANEHWLVSHVFFVYDLASWCSEDLRKVGQETPNLKSIGGMQFRIKFPKDILLFLKSFAGELDGPIDPLCFDHSKQWQRFQRNSFTKRSPVRQKVGSRYPKWLDRHANDMAAQVNTNGEKNRMLEQVWTSTTSVDSEYNGECWRHVNATLAH